ncbi:MAG TPA: hypothetical protein VFE42_18505 [Chloroflexota bacterium]|nr:hypothetical protein [Chloroflexota bacterium]
MSRQSGAVTTDGAYTAPIRWAQRLPPSATRRFHHHREVGALSHLDEPTQRYTTHPHFYVYVYPLAQQARETRTIGRVHARRITLDAIHK